FEQKCQSLVIQAEQLEDGRVKVVDVDALLAGAESELVSRADGPPALHAATGEPGREAVRIVVASRAFVGVTAVGNRGASKLAAPHDQRAVEQTARFQILQQGRGWAIDAPGHGRVDPDVIRVSVVPIVTAGAAGKDLDETHASLDEPSGAQT